MRRTRVRGKALARIFGRNYCFALASPGDLQVGSRKLGRVESANGTLRAFAAQLNEMAIATLKQDGEHAAMLFLRSDSGEVEPRLFGSDQHRGRILAQAAADARAGVVGVIAEAWTASEATVPDGARVRDSPDRRDILLVAALDRCGNQVVFETPVTRRRFRQPSVAESRERDRTFHFAIFDETRQLWGLPRRLQYSGTFGSLSLEVPARWSVKVVDGVIEVLPDTDDGAMHISIRGRDANRPLEPGEAQQIAANFAGASTSAPVVVDERKASWGLVAGTAFDFQDAAVTRHMELFVCVSTSGIVAATWNDEGSPEDVRVSARAIFDGMDLAPASG